MPSSSFSSTGLDDLKREFIWLVKNKMHRAKYRLNPNIHYQRISKAVIDDTEKIKEDIVFLKSQINRQKSLLKRDSKWYRNKYKKEKSLPLNDE